MKLNERQRERLWNILKGAGCSDEWLMHHGAYLCENIAALIEQPKQREEAPRVVYTSQSSGGFDPVSFATGMIIGDMFQ